MNIVKEVAETPVGEEKELGNEAGKKRLKVTIRIFRKLMKPNPIM